MKDNLEKAFKESLEGFEVPYDASAWNALSSKLDAAAGATGAAGGGLVKWLLIGATIGAAAIATFIFMPNGNENKVAEKTVVTTEKIDQPKQEEAKDAIVSTENEIEDTTISNQTDANTEKSENETVVPDVITYDGKELPNEKATNVDKTPTKPVIADLDSKKPSQGAVDSLSFIVGTIDQRVICQGNTISIKNNGSKGEFVYWNITENNDEGVKGVLESKEVVAYTPNSNATVTFTDAKGNVLDIVEVVVSESPTAEFTYEANIFDKGLPVVICESYGDYVNYTWDFAGEAQAKGAKANHHFFDKGSYDIKLKVTDANGCESTVVKTVNIREKYNLMAVNTFMPNGTDIRNRTFMPYSLTERKANFNLTIVDPITNEVVFESTDAQNAWNGINQRTGKMTESGKAYIWKVQIFNPLPNERPIYSGTVVHN